MRKAGLMLLLAAVSSGAVAAWIEVDSDETVIFHIDPTTIRRDGDLVRMQEVLEYKTAQARDHLKYMSSKKESEYDCRLEQWRTLSSTLHSGNMGGGRAVHSTRVPDRWRPVPPGGGIEVLWKIACGKGHC